MNIIWTQTAWSQYVEWQNKDKSMVKKINELLDSLYKNWETSDVILDYVIQYLEN